MTYLQGLFDFFVNGNFLQEWVVFFQLDPVRSITAAFGSNIPAHACHFRIFLLGTFQNHLDPVAFAFLCHCSLI